MECILCLEVDIIDNADHMRIYSVEGRRLEIRHIVEKHFWLRLDETKTSSICQSCWTSLRSFHEFYLRVEQTHKIYKNASHVSEFGDAVNPLASLDIPEDGVKVAGIKEEKNEALPPKRRRGRPRKVQNNPDSTEQLHLPFTDFIVDVDVIPTTNIIKQEDEPVLNDSVDVDALACDNDGKSPTSQLERIFEKDANENVPIIPQRRRGRPRKVQTIKTSNFHSKAAIKKSPRTRNTSSTADAKTDDLSNSVQANGILQNEELDTHKSCTSDERSDCEDADAANVTAKGPGKERVLLSKKFDEFIAANYKLVCCLCQQPLDDFTKLKTHFRTQHNIRGYALCCNKKLFKRGLLVDHIHTHIDPQYFKCPRCERVMADRRCLDVHIRTHDDKRERTYCCGMCSKSFFRQSIYMRHVLLHLPEEEKNVACPECDKTFATVYTMRQHLRLVHLNMYAKICDICGKSYRGRDAFRRHLEEHEGVQREPIQCDLCGSTLTTKYGLARHIKVMHTTEYRTPQKCSICFKVSPSLTAHQRHIKYMHTMERKHACPMCDKAFKRPTDLKEHMTTHTGEVLYTCPHCPKTFNSNANMHSHRKKVHRKEWEEKRLQRFQQCKPDADATANNKSSSDAPQIV